MWLTEERKAGEIVHSRQPVIQVIVSGSPGLTKMWFNVRQGIMVGVEIEMTRGSMARIFKTRRAWLSKLTCSSGVPCQERLGIEKSFLLATFSKPRGMTPSANSAMFSPIVLLTLFYHSVSQTTYMVRHREYTQDSHKDPALAIVGVKGEGTGDMTVLIGP